MEGALSAFAGCIPCRSIFSPSSSSIRLLQSSSVFVFFNRLSASFEIFYSVKTSRLNIRRRASRTLPRTSIALISVLISQILLNKSHRPFDLELFGFLAFSSMLIIWNPPAGSAVQHHQTNPSILIAAIQHLHSAFSPFSLAIHTHHPH